MLVMDENREWSWWGRDLWYDQRPRK